MRINEAASKPEDLKNAKATLTIKNTGGSVEFVLVGWDKKLGRIIADKSRSGAGGAYIIVTSDAIGGFGPMLYDAVMEWCSLHGGGLTADRSSVSSQARKVWNYYYTQRSDVKNHQLDDMDNTLTSTNDDNTSMLAASVKDDGRNAFGSFDFGTADWKSSPLSKRYTKEPDVLEKLKKMGILKESRLPPTTLREAFKISLNELQLLSYS